ncbi:Short-chain dehydrogenase TIC 32, chloroplastic [Zancudomyces culisetae]|uniref:Short-chain dehydrogenase TIC 32, chloroplastic n=1 Tax=Zancudomyces culisetae TaxID=1213189 RepID=A0A1R1PPP5_ZANCU|nr:Short-chain dehydrogenase TIC 32, chloroplastic [Zancudomyces culisetae]|eukprot:OMH82911.1 Short-chain dehydrogenase TIC 32, chloroplastic [Zancudomyces culisetae]
MGVLEVLTNCFKTVILKVFEALRVPVVGYVISSSSEIVYNILSKLKFGPFSAQAQINRYVEDFKLQREWKQQQVVEQPTLVAIVTGANSGIGYETAKAIVAAGFHTVFACRNKSATIQAIESITTELNKAGSAIGSCEFMELDLGSVASVKNFVAEFNSKHDRLDLLINNAGLASALSTTTADGIEVCFGTNHVGHHVLTNGLLDVMKKTPNDGVNNPRIVFVSSTAHYNAKYDKRLVTDPNMRVSFANYELSKLANIMCANELSRRFYEENPNNRITVNSLHPGIVYTSVARHSELMKNRILNFFYHSIAIGPKAGALTTIKLALSSQVSHTSGKYFERELELSPSAISQNPETWKDLWRFTEDLIVSHAV